MQPKPELPAAMETLATLEELRSKSSYGEKLTGMELAAMEWCAVALQGQDISSLQSSLCELQARREAETLSRLCEEAVTADEGSQSYPAALPVHPASEVALAEGLSSMVPYTELLRELPVGRLEPPQKGILFHCGELRIPVPTGTVPGTTLSPIAPPPEVLQTESVESPPLNSGPICKLEVPDLSGQPILPAALGLHPVPTKECALFHLSPPDRMRGSAHWRVDEIPEKYQVEFYPSQKTAHSYSEAELERIQPTHDEIHYWRRALPLPQNVESLLQAHARDGDSLATLINGWLAAPSGEIQLSNFRYASHPALGKFFKDEAAHLPLLMTALRIGTCDYFAWYMAALLRAYGVPAWLTTEMMSTKDGHAINGNILHARVEYIAKEGIARVTDPTRVCDPEPAFLKGGIGERDLQELGKNFKKCKNSEQRIATLQSFVREVLVPGRELALEEQGNKESFARLFEFTSRERAESNRAQRVTRLFENRATSALSRGLPQTLKEVKKIFDSITVNNENKSLFNLSNPVLNRPPTAVLGQEIALVYRAAASLRCEIPLVNMTLYFQQLFGEMGRELLSFAPRQLDRTSPAPSDKKNNEDLSVGKPKIFPEQLVEPALGHGVPLSFQQISDPLGFPGTKYTSLIRSGFIFDGEEVQGVRFKRYGGASSKEFQYIPYEKGSKRDILATSACIQRSALDPTFRRSFLEHCQITPEQFDDLLQKTTLMKPLGATVEEEEFSNDNGHPILQMYHLGAMPVDFQRQFGRYLLPLLRGESRAREQDQFESRDYVWGDDPRRIDWHYYARTEQLAVRGNTTTTLGTGHKPLHLFYESDPYSLESSIVYDFFKVQEIFRYLKRLPLGRGVVFERPTRQHDKSLRIPFEQNRHLSPEQFATEFFSRECRLRGKTISPPVRPEEDKNVTRIFLSSSMSFLVARRYFHPYAHCLWLQDSRFQLFPLVREDWASDKGKH